jgi:hypothetical protein
MKFPLSIANKVNLVHWTVMAMLCAALILNKTSVTWLTVLPVILGAGVWYLLVLIWQNSLWKRAYKTNFGPSSQDPQTPESSSFKGRGPDGI